MAKKEDDSSLKDNLSSAFGGKDKYEKDGGGHESYREWDNEKLMATVRSLTFPAVGEETMDALKGERHMREYVGRLLTAAYIPQPVSLYPSQFREPISWDRAGANYSVSLSIGLYN